MCLLQWKFHFFFLGSDRCFNSILKENKILDSKRYLAGLNYLKAKQIILYACFSSPMSQKES